MQDEGRKHVKPAEATRQPAFVLISLPAFVPHHNTNNNKSPPTAATGYVIGLLANMAASKLTALGWPVTVDDHDSFASHRPSAPSLAMGPSLQCASDTMYAGQQAAL
jgi:hypothetical protein